MSSYCCVNVRMMILTTVSVLALKISHLHFFPHAFPSYWFFVFSLLFLDVFIWLLCERAKWIAFSRFKKKKRLFDGTARALLLFLFFVVVLSIVLFVFFFYFLPFFSLACILIRFRQSARMQMWIVYVECKMTDRQAICCCAALDNI